MIGLLASVGCVRGGGSAPPPVGNPYLWYPALDLDTIPFTVGAGGWGATSAILAPAAPTVGAAVNVTNLSELLAALGSGANIVVTAGSTISGVVDIDGYNDIQITIEDGAFLVGGVQFSNGSRLRIRGSSSTGTGTGMIVGPVVGGQSGNVSDIIVEGIQQIDGAVYSEIYACDKVAYVRNCCKNGDIAYNFTNIVVAGCNFYAPNGWCVRAESQAYGEYKNYAIYACQLWSESNAVVRFHPAQSPENPGGYVWIGDTYMNSPVDGYLVRVDQSNLGQNVPVTSVLVGADCGFWSGTPGAEVAPTAGYCDYFDGDAGSTVYTTGGTYTPPSPGPGETWNINYAVGNSVSTPFPAWNAKNTAGDPTVLVPPP